MGAHNAIITRVERIVGRPVHISLVILSISSLLPILIFVFLLTGRRRRTDRACFTIALHTHHHVCFGVNRRDLQANAIVKLVKQYLQCEKSYQEYSEIIGAVVGDGSIGNVPRIAAGNVPHVSADIPIVQFDGGSAEKEEEKSQEDTSTMSEKASNAEEEKQEEENGGGLKEAEERERKAKEDKVRGRDCTLFSRLDVRSMGRESRGLCLAEYELLVASRLRLLTMGVRSKHVFRSGFAVCNALHSQPGAMSCRGKSQAK